MMKSRLFARLALVGALLSTSALSPVGPLAVQSVQAQSVSISFDLFFNELEPHGVWVRHPQYRHVFCPTGVDADWRPYTQGRWLYLADYGWYFASDEPFAWATYHYGRWLDDDNLGWCWVPGTKWAPAWVSWRRSDNIIGWAPLPPESDGYAVSVEIVRDELPEGYWVYVPTERFVEPELSVSIVFGVDQPDYYAQTQFLGPVVVEGDIVTNNVIEVTYIEQQINQEIVVYNVEEAPDPATATVAAEGNSVQVFTQDVAEPAEEAAPAEAVEEAEAPAVIAEEGGTAGATAGAEAEVEADANAAPADAAPAEAAPADPAAPASDAVPADAEAPAADPAAPAAEDPAAEPPCPPEVMVDGVCPPEATEPAPEAEAPAPDAAEPVAADAEAEVEADAAAEPAAPVEPEAAAPAADAAPAEDAAPAGEAAPAEEAAPVEEAAPEGTEVEKPLCPPELMVDGVCPPEALEGAEEEETAQ
ncbi:MAG: hypothetical protein KJ944_18525 [Alphaproteobacteria bacterium]|nr:hypothetical protein [Alphaproteobacteria bacterium]MBU2304585.1 hypothetical protein [Alphaproteobacteria bacterium]MBU2368083.1 hypothetical protein [Alphaproteobacteria bacterium]